MQQLLVIPTEVKHIGWPIRSLAEISTVPDITALPEGFPHLAGTSFHRGRIITLVHLWSIASLPEFSSRCSLTVRLASPNDHLAVLIPGVDAVLPYSPLELREESGSGLWAGLYPWEETWISVISPEAVATTLTASMAEYLRSQSGGRAHVL